VIEMATTVKCPECGDEHHKNLYDWQYIMCFKCGTYFEKHTGKKIEKMDSSYRVKDTDREWGDLC
jgi:ribosomal protein S27E